MEMAQPAACLQILWNDNQRPVIQMEMTPYSLMEGEWPLPVDMTDIKWKWHNLEWNINGTCLPVIQM